MGTVKEKPVERKALRTFIYAIGLIVLCVLTAIIWHPLDNRLDFLDRMSYSLFGLEKNGSRENACIVILCRNSDREDMVSSLRNFEQRFNKRFRYPYVFLNDKPFDDLFKESIKGVISKGSQAKVTFGLVPAEHWSYPPWIDQSLAAEKRKELARKKVFYGGSESYRFMCRYFSGFLHKHPLLLGYDYYWRIEPDVEFFCDIDYDVFKFMRENQKLYGFVIAMPEIMETVPTLWNTIMEKQKLVAVDKQLLSYFGNPEDPNGYNGCHFWTNFEIANMEFFRSPEYQKFFDNLEQSGGFFYERWGDAPVHSIAVGLFLRLDQVHYFEDIGYKHTTYTHCPASSELREAKKCSCSPFSEAEVAFRRCSVSWRELTTMKINSG